MGKLIDLTGQQFGRLVVLKRAETSEKSKPKWLCRCECGNEVTVIGHSLRSGITRSCGCLRNENVGLSPVHGASHSRLYKIWDSMKYRCYNSKCQYFHRYGGRGIAICDEWRDNFVAFREWALSSGYRDDLSIDRIDNDGNYCPENCRWATRKVQGNNQSTNHLLEYNGEIKTISQWSEITGIRHDTLLHRIKLGWSIEKVLTTPTKITKT